MICILEQGSPWSRTDNSLEHRGPEQTAVWNNGFADCSGLALIAEFQQGWTNRAVYSNNSTHINIY